MQRLSKGDFPGKKTVLQSQYEKFLFAVDPIVVKDTSLGDLSGTLLLLSTGVRAPNG